MYELSYELPNDLKLRILGNYKITRKSVKCLHVIASTQPTTQKPNFDAFGQILQKSQL